MLRIALLHTLAVLLLDRLQPLLMLLLQPTPLQRQCLRVLRIALLDAQLVIHLCLAQALLMQLCLCSALCNRSLVLCYRLLVLC